MLRRWPSKMHVDYVWGAQLRGLGNIADWKKRRVIFQQAEFGYITVESFTGQAKAAIRDNIRQYNQKINDKREKKRLSQEAEARQISLL